MTEYTVFLTMQFSVEADSAEEAEERAHSEAAAKLESRGIGALVVQRAEPENL